MATLTDIDSCTALDRIAHGRDEDAWAVLIERFSAFVFQVGSVRNLSHILAKCLCVMMKFSSVVRTRLAAVFDGGPAFDAAGPLQGPKR